MMNRYKIVPLFLLVLSFASCHVAKDEFASRMLFGEHWSILGMVIIIIVTALLYGIAHLFATSPTFRVKAGEYEYEIQETRYGTRTYKDDWGRPTHTVDFEETVGTGEYDTYRVTKAEERASIERERFTHFMHDLDIQCGYSCACLLSIAFTLLTNGLSGTEINGELVLLGLLMGLIVIVIYLYCRIKQSPTNPIELALSSDVAKYMRYTYIFGCALFFVCVCIGDNGFAAIGEGILFFLKAIFGIGYGVATLLDLWLNLSYTAFTAISAVVAIPASAALFKLFYKWMHNITASCCFIFLINFFCYLPCSFVY